MKKKAVIAMLVMCMALSAAACGEKKTSEETKSGKDMQETIPNFSIIKAEDIIITVM